MTHPRTLEPPTTLLWQPTIWLYKTSSLVVCWHQQASSLSLPCFSTVMHHPSLVQKEGGNFQILPWTPVPLTDQNAAVLPAISTSLMWQTEDLYSTHEPTVCCNSHNWSNWDYLTTRLLGCKQTLCQNPVKRVNFTLEQATKDHRRSRGIAVLFL